MKGFISALAGAALIAVGVTVPGAQFLIAAGAGMVLSGIGTMIAGNHPSGSPVSTSDPLRAWNVVVGQAHISNPALVYRHAWGNNNIMVDLVYVVAAHAIQSVDAVLFDGQVLPLDFNRPFGWAGGAYGHTSPTIGAMSYNPHQQDEPLNKGAPTVNGIICRANDVVTVTCPFNIPYLVSGSRIKIYGVPGDLTLNGTFIVDQIISQVFGSPGSIVFTFLSGGPATGTTVGFVPPGIYNAGHVRTLWPEYGNNVYFEAMLGDQVQGQTFNGMVYEPTSGTGPFGGTPWESYAATVSPEAPGFGPNALSVTVGPGFDNDDPNQAGKPNPWTLTCSLVGKAVVFLRLEYSDNLFVNHTLPNIGFLVTRKNDIYDPRLGPPVTNGISALALTSPGVNYEVGNVMQVDGGTGAFVQVTSVGGSGNITGLTFLSTWPGRNYRKSIQGLSGGHIGVGATVTISALTGSGADSTIGYSNNAALVIADYLAQQPVGTVNTASGMSWGYGAKFATPSLSNPPFNSINTPALIAAANICDTAVPIVFPTGGTEPMYACDGQFDLSMKRGEILSNLLTSCAGRLTYVGGQYYIYPGAWTAPVGAPIDLMPMLAGPIRWKPTVSIRDLYNGVKGSFISPANKWQASDFPYYAQDANHGYAGPSQYGGDINVALDGGERRWFDMHLPFTISPSRAQRIAKIELMRRRQQGTGTFVMNMAGWQFAPMDIIQANLPFLSWTGKYLEVSAVRFKLDKQGDGTGNETMALGTEVDVQEANSSVYDWSLLEQLSPQGYVEAYLPAPSVSEIVPFPWSPGYVAPLDGDAYYLAGSKDQGNFGMQVEYAANAQGNAVATNLQIKGQPPIVALDRQLGAPYIIATASATGGTLHGGAYTIGVTSRDSGASNYKNIYYRDFASVIVPAGTTGSINVVIEWSSGDTGGDLYMALLTVSPPQYKQLLALGEQIAQNVFHFQETLTPGQTTATITSFDASTAGGPDTVAHHLGVIWNKEIHSGPWATQVQAVTVNTVSVSCPGMTANQWAGYVLSVLVPYDPSLEAPIINMPVLSNTATSGTTGWFTMTIGPNAAGVQLPDLTTIVNVADLVTIRSKFTFTATSMSDPNIANGVYPMGATGVEKGHLAMVLTGADAGDVQAISSVTLDGGGKFTIFNLVNQWQVTPATGDLVVIIAPETVAEYKTAALSAPSKADGPHVVATPALSNLLNQPWVVTVRTEDIHGKHAPDFVAPRREIYFFGSQGTRTVTASVTQQPWDSLIEAECTTADIVYQCIPFSLTPNQTFTCAKLDTTTFGVTVKAATGDQFADGSTLKVLAKQGASFTWRVNA